MGASAPRNTTSTTVSDPWSAQQPYLKDLMAQAQKWYQGGGAKYFEGSTLAPESENTLEGQQGLVDFAKGKGQHLANLNLGAVSDILSGKYLKADSNPYLSGYTDAAVRPISQQFTESVLPNIRGDAMTTGGYGGSRQGIAEGLASGRFAQAIGDTTSGIYNNAYNTGMSTFSRAIDQAPGAFALGAAPSALQEEVGGRQGTRAQRVIDDARARWDYEQDAPRRNIQDYRDLITGNYGGTTNSTTPVARGNPLLGAAGGALSGAAAGSLIPGLGTGVGGVIGAILGGLGSR